MGSVAAVIVTYNRLEKLKRVVSSVLGQTRRPDQVIIVDNASTDATRDYLQSLASAETSVEVMTLTSNTGGAGGFAAGMERGYQRHMDFVWVMDDDGYPEATALATLLDGLEASREELGPGVPFACSVVKFIDGTISEMNNPVPSWDWGRLIARGQDSVLVNSCSFVSVLIPRWVIELYGLPYAEYFIWYDDAEFTQRISTECPGVQILSSIVLHDMGVNKGVNYGTIDDGNVWKFAYGARNEASFKLHHRGLVQYLGFCAMTSSQMANGRVALRLRSRIWRQLIRAVRFNPAVRYPGGSDVGNHE